MQVSPVSDVVKVEIDLTPDEALKLYSEINEISGQTPLTAAELNEKYPVTGQLLTDLNNIVHAETLPQP